MTKLEQIILGLKNQHFIYIHHFGEEKNMYRQTEFEIDFIHTFFLDFLVAPQDGIYNIEKLNKFTKQLIPKLKPDAITTSKIEKTDRSRLMLGSLIYHEDFGEEKRTEKSIITLNDEEKKASMYGSSFLGYFNREKTVIKNSTIILHRTHKIHIYPDLDIMNKVTKNEFYEMPKHRLIDTPSLWFELNKEELEKFKVK